MVELAPEVKLRDLIPKYYLSLGALASTSTEAGDQGWRQMYEHRAQELKEQIDAISADTE